LVTLLQYGQLSATVIIISRAATCSRVSPQRVGGGVGNAVRIIDVDQLDAASPPEGTEYLATDALDAADADLHGEASRVGDASNHKSLMIDLMDLLPMAVMGEALAWGWSLSPLWLLVDPSPPPVVQRLRQGARSVCWLPAVLGLAQSKLSFPLQVRRKPALCPFASRAVGLTTA
jgi:hypothetical protein